MRVKLSISGLPIELEADSKQEFRDALEVVVATLGGLKTPPHNASFRESETKPEAKEEVIRVSPSDTMDAPGGAFPQLDRLLDYKKVKTIAQHVLIAIEDLGELYGVDRHYSNNEILDHLNATGGTKLFTKRKTKPIAIVGQATRESDLLMRVEDEQGDLAGYKMKKWEKTSEPEEGEPEINSERELETGLGIQPLEP